jgi:hypothetical protein
MFNNLQRIHSFNNFPRQVNILQVFLREQDFIIQGFLMRCGVMRVE